jgi:hypothetical protein
MEASSSTMPMREVIAVSVPALSASSDRRELAGFQCGPGREGAIWGLGRMGTGRSGGQDRIG